MQQEIQHKLNTSFDDDYFNNIDEIMKKAIENIDDNIDHFDIDSLNIQEVPEPPYYRGTFDENGVPVEEKQRHAWRTIVNAESWIVLFEGGFRGGKDVLGLKAWADYLMITPERLHIALGITLEHALQTILLSGGFGIRYCLPHGQFVRKSINGAQRGVYEFIDAYGVQKEILFYGNAKKDDWEKFHGFNVGSFYVNEGRNQHINGLNEAIARTSASQHKLILITQNPTGPTAPYYLSFEGSNLGTLSEIELLEKIKSEYRDTFLRTQKNMYDKMYNTLKRKLGEFLNKKGVPLEWNVEKRKYGGFNYLGDEDQVEYKTLEKKIRFDFEQGVRSFQVKDFVNWIPKTNPDGTPNLMAGMSMKKVINYERGLENPNDVINYVDYYYYHFTFEDNPKMTDADRNDVLRRYPHGTAIFQQMVLGIRRAVEHALYPMFSERNVISPDDPHFDLKYFEEHKDLYTPFVAIDPGFNHYTGILFGYINYFNGYIYFVKEGLYDKSEVQEPKDVLTQYLTIVRSMNDRIIPMTCIDPSAAGTTNHFLNYGIAVIPADNSRLMPEAYETKHANKLQQKDLIGFELVRTYIKLGALQVHPSCPNLISQFESAEWVHDPEKDKDTRNKTNDDLSDPARYAINTFIGGTHYLIVDEELLDENENYDDEKRIRANEGKKNETRDLATDLQERINRYRSRENSYSRYRESPGEKFFSRDSRNKKGLFS